MIIIKSLCSAILYGQLKVKKALILHYSIDKDFTKENFGSTNCQFVITNLLYLEQAIRRVYMRSTQLVAVWPKEKGKDTLIAKKKGHDNHFLAFEFRLLLLLLL